MYAFVLSHLSHVWLFAALWTAAHQTPLSMGFSRQECWSGLQYCHALLYRIFPTQGLNLSLLHCRQFLYSLSQLGSPYIEVWPINNVVILSEAPQYMYIYCICNSYELLYMSYIYNMAHIQYGWVTQPYIYMYPFSPQLPSHPGCRITLGRVPVLYSMSLLVIYFKHSNMSILYHTLLCYSYIPNYPLSPTHPTLATINSFFNSVNLFSVL